MSTVWASCSNPSFALPTYLELLALGFGLYEISDRWQNFPFLSSARFAYAFKRTYLSQTSLFFHLTFAYHLNRYLYAAQFPMITTSKDPDREKSGAKLEAAFVTSSHTP